MKSATSLLTYVTVRDTVFETGLLPLRATVTVTRHAPFFRPLSDVPDNLQVFEDADATRRPTRAPDTTVSPAKRATVAAESAFFVVNAGALATVGVVFFAGATVDVNTVLITGDE